MAGKDIALVEKLAAKPLPILHAHKQTCLLRLADEKSTVGDLVPYLLNDSALVLAVLIAANRAVKHQRSINVLESAVSLLGGPQLAKTIIALPTVEEISTDSLSITNYCALLERQRHAAFQFAAWGQLRNDQSMQLAHEAVPLQNLGELAVCIHLPKQYQEIKTIVCRTGYAANAVSSRVLGVSFADLSEALGKAWRLPADVLECFIAARYEFHLVQGVILAGELARQADLDWYSQATAQCTALIADYLGLKCDICATRLHQWAVAAARNGVTEMAEAAAARLLLLPEVVEPRNPAAVMRDSGQGKNATGGKQAMLVQAQQQLVLRKDLTPTEVIRVLLQLLREEVGLERILFAKLQRRDLVCGASYGLGQDSPLRHLQVELRRQQLFMELIYKPQSLWVNSENVAKYSPYIPGEFKQAIDSENYFCMSLFYGARPLGLIIADSNNKPLTAQVYEAFKQVCTLANQALARLQAAHSESG